MYVKGQVKSLFTERDMENYGGRMWWDSMRTVYVPLRDFEVGRVNVSNVRNFILSSRK